MAKFASEKTEFDSYNQIILAILDFNLNLT